MWGWWMRWCDVVIADRRRINPRPIISVTHQPFHTRLLPWKLTPPRTPPPPHPTPNTYTFIQWQQQKKKNVWVCHHIWTIWVLYYYVWKSVNKSMWIWTRQAAHDCFCHWQHALAFNLISHIPADIAFLFHFFPAHPFFIVAAFVFFVLYLWGSCAFVPEGLQLWTAFPMCTCTSKHRRLYLMSARALRFLFGTL